ncbi:hypothetical protein IMCC13023_03610 [Candidatus Aquiluna sp. IMCC13023]|uniref:sulfotransferase family 2 domain-containing protein n=1 Tax=Candidatus Aquiluna sp. IMCC13023 TaxID=1081644 RepID=UPI00025B20C6|nr:sulfotransferase family 2 domain-containing protein [Candidatus Aquiluna sp. IMCC13023]EIC91882.1 hypothetical protein IMCC13023_03610 [Candidatus Aquiluna sp. IMCC13023]
MRFENILNRIAMDPTPTSDYAYFKNLGVAVCFIRKNGSSFLKHYMSCLDQGKEFQPPTTNPHVPRKRDSLNARTSNLREISAIFSDPSIPKVVIGRNPILRLESAYRSRVKVHNLESYNSDYSGGWVAIRQQILGWKLGSCAADPVEAVSKGISFQELAEYVVSTPSWELDQHYSPQVYFAATEDVEYSLVGKLEQLDSFLSDLSELVGKPQLEVPDGYRVNSAKASEESLALSGDLKARIEARFSADFEFFGYQS